MISRDGPDFELAFKSVRRAEKIRAATMDVGAEGTSPACERPLADERAQTKQEQPARQSRLQETRTVARSHAIDISARIRRQSRAFAMCCE
jgi:hypothetical protein